MIFIDLQWMKLSTDKLEKAKVECQKKNPNKKQRFADAQQNSCS